MIERLAETDRPRLVAELRSRGISPFYRTAESMIGSSVRLEGRDVLMFGSNNYLGLAGDIRVRSAAVEQIHRYGSATTGSRLLNGSNKLHVEIEELIAGWYRAVDALVFTSGYTANVGVLSALMGSGDIIVVDEYAHASIIDGARLSGAQILRFEHNNVESLRNVLTAAETAAGEALVVVDGLYSMEGSLAPLPEIVAICQDRGAAIMVDEAHSLGLYGESLCGWAEECGVLGEVDILMGSLSKGLGSTGGFIAGSAELIAGLKGTARSHLFTTSATPASLGAALESLRIVMSPEGRDIAHQVRTSSAHLAHLLHEQGVALDLPRAGWSPILSVKIGSDEEAVEVWNEILNSGVYVGVALHPAVPRGRSILRICVTADHRPDDLRHVADVIGTAVVGVPAL
ncbi:MULTISPECIES: aminotransferase class I/II-fold pyridoxal phosphate-dependent enzyme [Gordonia]|uniref:aminotransferase class I/II-fold pyridoxal phosphate-dependent enzyme n=1 Tax=Gordonia TaxID=2053 RepID=UPI0019BB53A4|nr:MULTISPECIES: aminotransferase class I/II-fold pyridoxal phosphate-dependent enzyme [Gordonia]MBD0020413.1 aminotransferase class I/II-fold pyridoxal phosphate-dependent enzyme [Gordonia sp. (in: high G+C Gram-positive bacteria)]